VLFRSLVLLATVSGTAVTIDGKPLEGGLTPKPGKRYESFVTEPLMVKLAPGDHQVEVSRAGYAGARYATKLEPGVYEIVGASLDKIDAAAPAAPAGPQKGGGGT